jgi:hypothetical protein
MRAIVLERNKMVNRRLARFLHCAGLSPVVVDDPADVVKNLDGADLVCADAFDGDLVTDVVQKRPQLRAVLWTAEPLDRSLRYLVDNERISNILGRPDFDSTPRDWELMMVMRRLARPADGAPPLASYLHWGFTGFQTKVGGSEDRDVATEKVQRFVTRLGVPSRVVTLLGELTHELLMNAVFDAPVDKEGKAKYAGDRRAKVTLSDDEQPTLRLAADGARIVVQVSDPFGGLERRHVFGGLARGLRGGEQDRSHGGAGLGMMVCHNSTVAMIYDVVKSKKTEVTGIFDLDMNLREFRTQGKSLHFFHAEP